MRKGKELCPQCEADLAKPQIVEGVVPTRSQEESDRLAGEAQEKLREKVRKMEDEQRRAWANVPPIRFTI